MSLKLNQIEPIPELTTRVARAAFPKGNLYLTLRDELGTLFDDEQFKDLFPTRGKPAFAPWRLALITLLQFAEGLSDRQAAEAVRSRIDWKYLLSLTLEDPGFDSSVLCEFRARLRSGEAEERLLNSLLTRFQERNLLKARGRQRTDSTHVLACVRALNRVELVVETMRHTLDILATVAPEWLLPLVEPAWEKRYARRAEDDRLPKKEQERQALVAAAGDDGRKLLSALYSEKAPDWLRHIPAVDTLRIVWMQNYTPTETGLVWREADNIAPARTFVSSPYDPQAHLSKKRSTCWVGYKIHLTETCEDDLPNLVTHIETTVAPAADGEVTPRVHQALQEKNLLPKTHIVDTGYLDAALMVDSNRDFGVDLLGPARPDVKWQAQEGKGFSAQYFQIDWEKRQAICPEGHASTSWSAVVDKHQNHLIKIKFSTTDCGACSSRDHCIRSQKRYVRRTITLRCQEQHEALAAARQRVQTAAYQQEYACRAGIEGTLSRIIRRCRVRRSRYRGLIRVHLGHVLTAALNLLRVGEWLQGVPKTVERLSPFARFMGGAVSA